MSSLNSLDDDKALFVAEQFIDYCHKKERRERQIRLANIEHNKEMKSSRRLVALLSLMFFLMIGLCIIIVSLNIEVKQREQNIVALEEEVLAAKKENKEAGKRLANQIDYKWVRDEAKKLGMSVATPDRVFYYTVEDEDFMVQYEDVPDK